MQLSLPQQLSSVPEIDSGAMSWASGTIDTLNRLLGNVHAISFVGNQLLIFSAATATGQNTMSNLPAFRLPNGTYLTPTVVLATAGKAPGGRTDIIVTADPVVGGCKYQAITPGAAFTDNVPVYILMLA